MKSPNRAFTIASRARVVLLYLSGTVFTVLFTTDSAE